MTFFREILTIAAIALLAVLTALLVGPWFVDWNGRRGQIEALLGEATGFAVSVGGDIDVKLLPVPQMHLGEVSVRPLVGEAASASAAQVQLEMAIAPLLRGALRFVEMRIERPRVALNSDGNGGLALPPLPKGTSTEVAFERITVNDGAITVARPGAAPLAFERLTFETDSPALEGPYKGQGRVRAFGRDMAFRFGTGVNEPAGLRTKFIIDETAATPRAEFDGTLSLAAGASGGVVPGFDGALVMSGRVAPAGEAVPWRLSGPIRLEAGAARVEPAEVRVGAEGRSLIGNGAATLTFGDAPHLALKLAAPQADLDFFASDKRDPGAGMALLRDLIATVSAGPGVLPVLLPGLGFDIEASVPAVIAGGETMTDLTGRAARPASADGRAAIDLRFDIGLPGRAQVKANGTLETGMAAKFTGQGAVNLRDPVRFGQWLGRGWPNLAARLEALPFRTLDVAGAMEVSSVAFAGRGLTIQAERSALSGAVIFTHAVGPERARLFADLQSQALDLEGLPDIGTPLRSADGVDLNLALDARAVRIARFGAGMVDSGRIRMKLSRTGDVLTLDDVAIDNLGGASLSVRGDSRPGAARLEARLNAERLSELAALVRRVAPGPAAEAFASRAVALSPARLTFSAEGTGTTPAAIVNLRLDGTARGTAISGSVAPQGAGGAVAAQFNVENADAHMLLRQMGFETVALSRFGAGRVQVQANGRAIGDAARVYATTVDATLAGTRLSFQGDVSPGASALDGNGRVRLTSANLAPLMQILALALPDAGSSLPADIGGLLRLSGGGFAFTEGVGKIAGSAISGRLERAASTSRVTGALEIDRLAFGSLTSLVFGPTQPPRAGQRWPDLKFAPAALDAPPASVVVTAAVFEPGVGLPSGSAQFRLGLEANALHVDDLRLRSGAADVSGSLTLRRDRDQALASGKVSIAAPLSGRFGMDGQMAGAFEFAGSGGSEAALIAGLGGRGSMTVTGLRITAADPAALDQTIAAVEREQLVVEPLKIEAQMQKALAARPLTVEQLTLDSTIAGGVVRAQSPVFATGAAEVAPRAQMSATFNLRTFAADVALDLTSVAPPKDWSGEPPKARLTRREVEGKAERALEIASLVNVLSGRAIEREAARAAAFEADVRERAAFARRLRAQEFVRQREAEIAAWKIEQARIAEEEVKREAAEAAKAREAERQAQEAARLKAEAERRAQERAGQERAVQERAAQERAAQERAVQDAIRPTPTPPVRGPVEVVPRQPPPRAPAIVAPRPDGSPSGIY